MLESITYISARDALEYLTKGIASYSPYSPDYFNKALFYGTTFCLSYYLSRVSESLLTIEETHGTTVKSYLKSEAAVNIFSALMWGILQGVACDKQLKLETNHPILSFASNAALGYVAPWAVATLARCIYSFVQTQEKPLDDSKDVKQNSVDAVKNFNPISIVSNYFWPSNDQDAKAATALQEQEKLKKQEELQRQENSKFNMALCASFLILAVTSPIIICSYRDLINEIAVTSFSDMTLLGALGSAINCVHIPARNAFESITKNVTSFLPNSEYCNKVLFHGSCFHIPFALSPKWSVPIYLLMRGILQDVSCSKQLTFETNYPILSFISSMVSGIFIPVAIGHVAQTYLTSHAYLKDTNPTEHKAICQKERADGASSAYFHILSIFVYPIINDGCKTLLTNALEAAFGEMTPVGCVR